MVELADQSYPLSVLTPLSIGLLLSLQTLFCGVDEQREQPISQTPGADMLLQAKQFVKDNISQRLFIRALFLTCFFAGNKRDTR